MYYLRIWNKILEASCSFPPKIFSSTCIEIGLSWLWYSYTLIRVTYHGEIRISLVHNFHILEDSCTYFSCLLNCYYWGYPSLTSSIPFYLYFPSFCFLFGKGMTRRACQVLFQLPPSIPICSCLFNFSANFRCLCFCVCSIGLLLNFHPFRAYNFLVFSFGVLVFEGSGLVVVVQTQPHDCCCNCE